MKELALCRGGTAPPRGLARAGFTLPEVLVVTLLIAVLVAMLLPGLMQARVAARRVQCVGRLREIGMAVAQYEVRFHVLPTGNFNLVEQLEPIFGQVDTTAGTVSEVYRCPADRFLPLAAYDRAISYAPLENGRTDEAFEHCAWSIAESDGVTLRARDTVAPDTVLMLDSWHPANQANVGLNAPGWVRPTLNWKGAACPETIPTSAGLNVGGYLFLRGFDADAEGLGRPHRLSRIFHGGYISTVRADGRADSLVLREVTRTSPAAYPIWTRAAD